MIINFFLKLYKLYLCSVAYRQKRPQKLSHSGGCELGARPIDMHLKAFRQLGVSIDDTGGYIKCKADSIRGAGSATPIILDFPSVGATENIMLLSVFIRGKTIIQNAAKEPEIVDLQNFLNGMGASVSGAGTDTITITGVNTLKDVTHSVIADRIVAGTYMAAAAITGGSISLKNVVPEHIAPITARLREIGCTVDEMFNELHLKSPPKLRAVNLLRTNPHPAFPTDMQPQIMSLLTLAQGTSIIIETVFEARFKHVPDLVRMGANITTDNRTAVIQGTKRLQGTVVSATDLRCGAGLIIAGLAAGGETVVLNASHVQRGYENIEGDLYALGADIKYFDEVYNVNK